MKNLSFFAACFLLVSGTLAAKKDAKAVAPATASAPPSGPASSAAAPAASSAASAAPPAASSAPAGGALPPGSVAGYPPPDKVPPTDSPEVQAWLKLVDFSKVPTLPLSKNGECANSVVDPNACWWTCQKCTRPEDIVYCPKTSQWGLTYDDGPTVHTPQLLDYLKQNNIKSTMFVVGSRVIQNPDVLRREYAEGHHIAVHTWSHSPLTSLTNEQIVAEVKWTEKAIKDTIGVTPVYMRPPYGDYDDRVRAIMKQLGYKTVIWTDGFDTQDWQIPAGQVTTQQVIGNFSNWLPKIQSMQTGFIVLEHDLYPQTVQIAIQNILPAAIQNKLQMMPVPQCIGDGSPYLELLGQGNTTLPGGQKSGNPSSAPGGSTFKVSGASSTVSGKAMLALAVAAAFSIFA
ncbi:uncharacterized protein VTP21DRAFT_2446 [Calcarisporiella thermophila]|uniref:uncharacterized protein n=1 Tax=Calcarisporiella thermophila TaxID=911321 RepID=UPI0037440427